MLEAPDQQISLTDPDARSMNARGSGIVGYNVQTAVDPKNHLIVSHEVLVVREVHVARAWRSAAAHCARFHRAAVGESALSPVRTMAAQSRPEARCWAQARSRQEAHP